MTHNHKPKSYEEYERMINSVIRKWQARYPWMDIDDFHYWAVYTYCDCLDKWKEDRGYYFSTYLLNSMDKNFINVVRRAAGRLALRPEFDFENDLSDNQAQKRRIEFWETMDSLSDEAKEVVNLIFSCPGEIWDRTTLRLRILRDRLLAKNTQQTIDAVFNEIKLALRNF